jgi:ligand-binding sensor domain-containing protein
MAIGRRTAITGLAGAAGAALLAPLAPRAGAQAQGAPPAGGGIENFEVGGNVYVRALAVAEQTRTLWVGTSVGALEIDLETREVRNTFTRKDGLANEYVFAIAVDPAGAVWFGTNAGGASRYDRGNWRTYFPMHGLADYWVYAFAFDRKRNLWMGTWDGASYFEPAGERFTNYRQELVNVWVYGLDIDPEGRVWFGTEGGVSMYDGKTWRSWTHADGLGAPNSLNLPASANTGLGTRARHDLNTLTGTSETYNPNYVFAALVDRRDASLWFGTWGGGVSHLTGETWTSYGQSDGLAGNVVYAIAQEPDGALWFGTNHGATRYDGRIWRNYSRQQGIVGDNVYSIAIAPDRSVWLACRGGVSRLPPQQR